MALPTAATAKAGHPISPLLNTWHSGGASYGTGNPSYVIRHGIVHLSGSVIYGQGQPYAGSSQWIFAKLPEAARPTDCFGENVDVLGGGFSLLIIDPGNGHIYGADADFTSLAGLSYPAAPVTWHILPLLTGGTPWPSCNTPSFHLSNGVVYLTGGMQLSGDHRFAVLPPAALANPHALFRCGRRRFLHRAIHRVAHQTEWRDVCLGSHDGQLLLAGGRPVLPPRLVTVRRTSRPRRLRRASTGRG